MAGDDRAVQLLAWRPEVHGIAEVFHARFVGHAYPAHTHGTWTLLIVDTGAVEFLLGRRRHHIGGREVVLLPPGVSHDGRAATPEGFRKRVVYLDGGMLPERMIGPAVDAPVLADRLLRRRVHELHRALDEPGEEFEAESRLALINDRLVRRLGSVPAASRSGRDAARLAGDLRDLLDARVETGISLREAGALLHAHPTHLVRCFKQTFGLPPHLYLTGRRIERARRLLIEGHQPGKVAAEVGFYDQAHMTRHFRRHLGITPARFAATRHLRSA
ncbi:AraC family transcriptional regulator [Actinomadura sp. SCN-SB]|uniref:helix-turn-helix transcriptional regulator n=1 Tax=Actinomadura sp. SCN-SB TaxID=3373092 RepID=UPI00375062F0